MAAMRIGVSTLTYVDLDYRTALDRILPLGVRVIELFFDYPQFKVLEVGPGDVEYLKRLRGKRDLEFTLHTPCFDLNPASVDEAARRTVVEQYRNAVRFAAALGIAEVVVHSGFRSSPKFSTAQAFDASLATLRETVRFAEGLGVRVAVENTGYGETGFLSAPQDLVDLVDGASSPLVGITLDTTHAYLEGFRLDEAVRAFAHRLSHLHVHDSLGGDDHLPIGEGRIDFAPLFEALRSQAFGGLVIWEGWIHDRIEERIERDLTFLRQALDLAGG